MMVPLLLSIQSQQEEHGCSMEGFYRYKGITRQGFSKAKRRYEAECEMMDEVLPLVADYRKNQDNRAGSRSLFYNLGIKTSFGIGVNKFERLLSMTGLSLRPLRIKVVTTRSCFQSWNYPNLLSGKVLNDINQAVVGDLTYLNYLSRRYYLFCLKDLYSARIVGYHIGEYMRAEDARKALLMLIELRGEEALSGLIHHTDGGSQYFAKAYVELCIELGIEMSCARSCLENGYAEQLNGLIKNHLLPTFKTDGLRSLKKEMECAISVYNNTRKQAALGWLSPVEFEEKIRSTGIKHPMKLHKFD